QGGHDETWGGVRINIDRSWVDLGIGSVPTSEPAHCGGVRLGFSSYAAQSASRGSTSQRKALQCLLTEQHLYGGPVDGTWSRATVVAVTGFQRRVKHRISGTFWVTDWVSLLSAGAAPVVKLGSASPSVRRVQRSLNAALGADLTITGLFDGATQAKLRAYQTKLHLSATSVAAAPTWTALQRGAL
ncbi:MAG: peptidoglycan-binding protein, partial [Actinomycetota bacterium]|nr:peptidoglycan-binding protein [Actinomycetota bacterium]